MLPAKVTLPDVADPRGIVGRQRDRAVEGDAVGTAGKSDAPADVQRVADGHRPAAGHVADGDVAAVVVAEQYRAGAQGAAGGRPGRAHAADRQVEGAVAAAVQRRAARVAAGRAGQREVPLPVLLNAAGLPVTAPSTCTRTPLPTLTVTYWAAAVPVLVPWLSSIGFAPLKTALLRLATDQAFVTARAPVKGHAGLQAGALKHRGPLPKTSGSLRLDLHAVLIVVPPL